MQCHLNALKIYQVHLDKLYYSIIILSYSSELLAIYIQWNPSYPESAYPGTSAIRSTNLTPKIKININGVNSVKENGEGVY